MRTILESKKWLTLICLAAALSLTTTACGSDDDDATDNNTPAADAGNDADEIPDKEDGKSDGEDDGDTDVEDDGHTDDEDDGYTDDEDDGYTDEEFTCDIDGFEIDSTEGVLSEGGSIASTSKTEEDATSGLHDRLIIELYGNTPGFVDTLEPYVVGETYDIDDVDYASCIDCVFILSDCDDAEDEDDIICDSRYNAAAGALTIDALDEVTGEFKATLADAQFVEVIQVGEYGVDTVIVEDGNGWCIDSLVIEGTLDVPDVPDAFEGPDCSDSSVETGFDVAETLVSDYFGFWVTGRSSLDEPYNQLELNLGGAEYLTGETYPIDGITGCENCAQIWTECVGDMGDCSGTIYGAGSGTLLINEHDETTGVFKVTVQDAEFVEITADDDIVENGAGWCVDSAVLEGNYMD